MFSSLSSKVVMYPAAANLAMLRRELVLMVGTMSVCNNGWDGGVEDSYLDVLFEGVYFIDVVGPLRWFADLLLFNLAGRWGYVG
jgi:hypothetical protein